MPRMTLVMSTALTLSLLHAILPDHWLPFLLVGRAQRWSRRKMIRVTFLAGSAHIASTTALGVLVALLGMEIAHQAERVFEPLAGAAVVGIGVLYIFAWVRERGHGDSHHHAHSIAEDIDRSRSPVSDRTATATLIGTLAISPCVALLPFYFLLGSVELKYLIALSLVVFVGTTSGMTAVVALTSRGLNLFNLERFERFERPLIGSLFFILGAFILFFRI